MSKKSNCFEEIKDNNKEKPKEERTIGLWEKVAKDEEEAIKKRRIILV